ncbi:hypothetical protein KEJ37_06075 [Candidatus Bathyarchaeota archaeon]|nr:hypothetical protein [Candidatus Bathyarchaeota archaeon]
MPHVAIEYVIMVPILIAQIFLFPLAASALTNIYVESRRRLTAETAASRLASSIQQLYFSLNHESTPPGTVTFDPDLPQYIDGYHYVARGELTSIREGGATRLNISLTVVGLDIRVSAYATLGPNVNWDSNSVFVSNSTSAFVEVTKGSNGTFHFRFGGG